MFSVAAFSGLNYILLASSYCEKVGAANAAFSLPLETLMTDRHFSVQSIAKWRRFLLPLSLPYSNLVEFKQFDFTGNCLTYRYN